LFYLIIDNIELTVVDPTVPASQKNTLPKFTFRNYVGDDFDFDQFAAVADYLLGLGITLEEAKELQPVGPELTAAKLGDLKAVVDLTNAGLKIMPVQKIVGGGTGATAKATAAKPKPVAAARTTGLYQIEKETTVYRPCFEPPLSRRSDVDAALLCGSSTTESGGQTAGNLQSSGGFSAAALAPILQQIRADFIATHQPGSTTSSEIARLPNLPPGKKLQLRLYTRSTEAILRQLGSIVARDLYPSFDGRRVIQVKVGEPYLPYPPDPCPKTSNPDAPKPIGAGYRCENLFVLALDTRSANSPLSVDYDGKTYLVPGDSQVAGRTMGLLDLAKQLLALHTAAKELPASNVLNVIGGTP